MSTSLSTRTGILSDVGLVLVHAGAMGAASLLVELIWSSPFGLASMIFFANRYLPFVESALSVNRGRHVGVRDKVVVNTEKETGGYQYTAHQGAWVNSNSAYYQSTSMLPSRLNLKYSSLLFDIHLIPPSF
ncbi:hypothetical protein EV359DRAFT_60480 [Lentinula novae-zelandiae]|nr:hypothetical protein EV359DRAFT_60480 [Lentinula novae-zelandiae]